MPNYLIQKSNWTIEHVLCIIKKQLEVNILVFCLTSINTITRRPNFSSKIKIKALGAVLNGYFMSCGTYEWSQSYKVNFLNLI